MIGSRSFSALADPQSYTVGELTAEIRSTLETAFTDLWVRGEIQRIHESARGHLYFELIEKGAGDQIVGKLDAVIWRSAWARLRRRLKGHELELAAGQQVRCFGELSFYGAGGRLQLVVNDIDPELTLGHLERRRRQTLRALEAADLLSTNGALPIPAVPLRVGLITSHESAAYHDVLSGLVSSGYGFEVLHVHASVQGQDAPSEISEALEVLASSRLHGQSLDVILLVRGGGARSDLAAFDSRAVAFAVAQCQLPVLCGLGHETDRTVVDVVCHTSEKTPTQIAETLVNRVAEAEVKIITLAHATGTTARNQLAKAEQLLARSERLAHVAQSRLESARRRLADVARRLHAASRLPLVRLDDHLNQISRRLGRGALRQLAAAGKTYQDLGRQISRQAASRLEQQRLVLNGLDRLCHSLDPQRTLERGFSITRDADGRVLTDADQIASGDRILTRLAGGEIASRVEGSSASKAKPSTTKRSGEQKS